MKNFLKGKNVLVTGACGTVGRELTRQILSGAYGRPAEFVGIDNNESELFALEHEYGSDVAHFYLRDLRNYRGLREICSGIDIVFHTAALKHVGICEKSPTEAVLTNITGLQNLIKAAKRCGVERFIFTSSDKAVNPTNVMGTSKLMGERLVTAANNSRENRRTIFASTRFGNVLGSRGSVVPIFQKQIVAGQDITITNFGMTRFIMTIREATKLVVESSMHARGGEVFITKMPVARIVDLAEVMREILTARHALATQSNLVEIGVKPGEKMYEELMSAEETSRAVETEDFFIVLPAFRDMYPVDYEYSNAVENSTIRPYNSAEEAAMSKSELKIYLERNEIL